MSLGRNERRRPWQCLRIGTWNVLSLYRPGASNILKQEVEKVQMDLVALQEIRWLGNGTLEKKNCVIFYSRNPKRHVLGVGFYVNTRFLPNILRFEPVSDRLCSIRVCGKFRNYSIINVHAPTEDKDDEEKDKFYLELETIYSRCPKHDIKMVLGDFNAKIGKEGNNYPYAGRNGLHDESNGKGVNWYSSPPQQILLWEPSFLIRIHTK
jgi:exonuclease III